RDRRCDRADRGPAGGPDVAPDRDRRGVPGRPPGRGGAGGPDLGAPLRRVRRPLPLHGAPRPGGQALAPLSRRAAAALLHRTRNLPPADILSDVCRLSVMSWINPTPSSR